MTRKLTENQIELMLKLKIPYTELPDIKPLSECQKKDLSDKENVLKNLDYKNPLHLEFATIMLNKGFGYTPEKVKDGFLELTFGHSDDFAYCCQIGVLIDQYLVKQPYSVDFVNTTILNIQGELFKNQLKICAENITLRLSLIKKIIAPETDVKSNTLKQEVLKQLKQCELILNS